MRLIRGFLGVLLVLGLAGLGYASFDPTGFTDRKREVRLALGLPKAWATNFNADVTDAEPLACPGGDALVIVTGGQSNAANALSDPLGPDAAAAAYMMLGGRCYRLRDPVLGATATGGSLWTALGSALHARTGRPVVFINGAVGGSQLGDWLDARSGYADRLAGEIAAARAAGLVADMVIWVQGETDAKVRLAPLLFVRQLEGVMALLDGPGLVPAAAPWLVVRSTSCMDRPGNGPELDAAVAEWAATRPGVVLGPLASALGPAMRWDGCHFNGRGREVLVGEMVEIFDRQNGGPGPQAPAAGGRFP